VKLDLHSPCIFMVSCLINHRIRLRVWYLVNRGGKFTLLYNPKQINVQVSVLLFINSIKLLRLPDTGLELVV
jgi:hypothetical protein